MASTDKPHRRSPGGTLIVLCPQCGKPLLAVANSYLHDGDAQDRIRGLVKNRGATVVDWPAGQRPAEGMHDQTCPGWVERRPPLPVTPVASPGIRSSSQTQTPRTSGKE
jgi:hypothetical protein